MIAAREADSIEEVSLVLNDPSMELSDFFSTCTLCLCTNLVSLRLHSLKVNRGQGAGCMAVARSLGEQGGSMAVALSQSEQEAGGWVYGCSTLSR